MRFLIDCSISGFFGDKVHKAIGLVKAIEVSEVCTSKHLTKLGEVLFQRFLLAWNKGLQKDVVGSIEK